MKKNFLTAFLLLCTLSLIFAFSRAPDTVVGHINFYGNAPHAYPGIVTVEGEVFSIRIEEGASFTLDDIKALQGHMIRFDGKIDRNPSGTFETLKDGVFTVFEFEDLSKTL